MFALPGIILLIIVIYARPHEFVDALAAVPVINYAVILAAFGLLLDIRLRMSKLLETPHVRWAIAFYAWCIITLALEAPGRFQAPLQLTVALLTCLVMAHGIQTFKGFQTVCAVLLALGLFVTSICVHQGFSDFGCVRYIDGGDRTHGTADGRPCETPDSCMEGETEPGASYHCEHIGLLGTTSIGHGRVRYRGVLQDPNEVALVVGIAMPLAFAFRERKRTMLRTALLLATIVSVGICIVMTQSRGGQIVFAAVLGAYFTKKYGVRGLIAGAVLALPLLLYGGRSGDESEHSSIERLECWYEGMSMLIRSPLLGVGYQQFTDHHYLTAHSSFVLSAAELGVPGATLFTGLLYTSVKIPFVALRRYSGVPGTEVAQTWAMALLAVFAGLIVGIVFLSFTYHYVLWIHFGLASAFYTAIRSHDPEFEVPFGWRDLGLLLLIQFGLLFFLIVYTRLKV